MRLIVGFYQMSDGIELFKSVGKTAALWNLVLFAIEMTSKIQCNKKFRIFLLLSQGEHLNSDFRKHQFRPTRQSISPEG